MMDLTQKQERLLRYLYDYIRTNGYPPSLREICVVMGITSLRGAATHLRALERKDLIQRGSLARSIRIRPKGLEYLGEKPLAYLEYFVMDYQSRRWVPVRLHRQE